MKKEMRGWLIFFFVFLQFGDFMVLKWRSVARQRACLFPESNGDINVPFEILDHIYPLTDLFLFHRTDLYHVLYHDNHEDFCYEIYCPFLVCRWSLDLVEKNCRYNGYSHASYRHFDPCIDQNHQKLNCFGRIGENCDPAHQIVYFQDHHLVDGVSSLSRFFRVQRRQVLDGHLILIRLHPYKPLKKGLGQKNCDISWATAKI